MRKYWIITISTSIAILGIPIASWHYFLRGEHIAQLVSGKVEHQSVVQPDFNGSNWLTNYTDIIDGFVRRDDITDLQSDLLSLAFDSVGTNGIECFWCVGSTVPSSGNWTIATADAYLYNFTNATLSYWAVTTATNSETDLICAVDRVYDDSMNYNPAVYADQLKGIDEYYSSAVPYSSNSIPVNGSWNWWNYIGNGTNLYIFSYPDYFIRTNELNEMANILTNTLYSVAFAPITAVNFSQIRRYKYGDFVSPYTNRVDNDWEALDENDMLTEVNNHINDFDSPTYPSTWDGVVSDITVIGEMTAVWDQEWSGGAWYDYLEYSRYSVYVQAAHTEIDYSYFNWPSAAAFSGGYISKFSVYAVTTASVCDRANRAQESEGYREITLYSDVQPNHYESRLYNLADVVCALPSNATVPSDSKQYIEPVSVFDNYSEIKLDLIYSVSNPSSRPTFTIGSYSTTVSFSLTDFDRSSDEAENYEEADNWYQDRRYFIDFDNTVTIRGFVLVVVWKFNHMNPANPYSPTIYNP